MQRRADLMGRTTTSRGRGFEHGTVLDAFVRNPTLVWTPAGLSTWYGIRVDYVRTILRELVGKGVVQRLPGNRYLLRAALRRRERTIDISPAETRARRAATARAPSQAAAGAAPILGPPR